MREISWLAENRLASQEGLCSMEEEEEKEECNQEMDWPDKRLHSFKEGLDYVLRYQCDMIECLTTWAPYAVRVQG